MYIWHLFFLAIPHLPFATSILDFVFSVPHDSKSVDPDTTNFQVGDLVRIKWVTNIDSYTINLCQNDAQVVCVQIFEKTVDQAEENGFQWNLSSSYLSRISGSKFFLRSIYKDGADDSQEFNITSNSDLPAISKSIEIPSLFSTATQFSSISIWLQGGPVTSVIMTGQPTKSTVLEPISTCSPDTCCKIYITEKGDSCVSIAARMGITEEKLEDWNPGMCGSSLEVGMDFCVSGPIPSDTSALSFASITFLGQSMSTGWVNNKATVTTLLTSRDLLTHAQPTASTPPVPSTSPSHSSGNGEKKMMYAGGIGVSLSVLTFLALFYLKRKHSCWKRLKKANLKHFKSRSRAAAILRHSGRSTFSEMISSNRFELPTPFNVARSMKATFLFKFELPGKENEVPNPDGPFELPTPFNVVRSKTATSLSKFVLPRKENNVSSPERPSELSTN